MANSSGTIVLHRRPQISAGFMLSSAYFILCSVSHKAAGKLYARNASQYPLIADARQSRVSAYIMWTALKPDSF